MTLAFLTFLKNHTCYRKKNYLLNRSASTRIASWSVPVLPLWPSTPIHEMQPGRAHPGRGTGLCEPRPPHSGGEAVPSPWGPSGDRKRTRPLVQCQALSTLPSLPLAWPGRCLVAHASADVRWLWWMSLLLLSVLSALIKSMSHHPPAVLVFTTECYPLPTCTPGGCSFSLKRQFSVRFASGARHLLTQL